MTRLLAILALLSALPAAAQDRTELFRLGDDVFAAGASVALSDPGLADVFAAGERVDLGAPITGSAHLTGRRVNVDAEIGGDLYAAGADVTVTAPVAGSATLTGYDVTVQGAIGAALRGFGTHIRVEAPVAGTALLAGDSVTIEAVLTGDVALAANELAFGPEARLEGRLILYDDDGDLSVPDRVIAPDRIERRATPDRPAGFGAPRLGPLALVSGFLIGIVVLAVLATLVALIAPQHLERMRDLTGERPFRTFWIGFLALSALIGASVLLVMTLIGIFVAPAVIVIAVALGILGYVIAAYLVGRTLWGWFGALPPDTFVERTFAALLGAAAVSLLALVPFLGWLAILILTLTGLGALTVAVFRPELRSDY